MAKRKILKTDKFIPLLSDTLPYEVPFPFSNMGFYNIFRNLYDNEHKQKLKTRSIDIISKKLLKNEQKELLLFNTVCNILTSDFFEKKVNIKGLSIKDFRPYKYKIKKNNTDTREMTIVHPLVQLKICDIYHQFENELLYYTNLSKYSLRHPYRKLYYFKLRKIYDIQRLLSIEYYIDDDNNHDNNYDRTVNLNDDISNNLNMIEKFLPQKYFTYEKYDFLYKFYNSKEYMYLEKKYEFCFKVDVKHCFDSIYTHSIVWAIYGKEYAKRNINKDKFAKEMDDVMQSSNWRETHGIPIGSEFSRIFAEIIFQRIDNNIMQEIKKRFEQYKFIDYRIYRYVDDFFIFVNNYEYGEKIKEIISEQLNEYRMYINDKKYECLKRPFVTNISSSKDKIMIELYKIFKSFSIPKIQVDNDEEQFSKIINNLIENIIDSSKNIYNFVNFIRVVTYDNKIQLGEISNIILHNLYNKIFTIYITTHKLYHKVDNEQESNYINFIRYFQENEELQAKYSQSVYELLSKIIRISFYIFALSPRANSVYNIAKICFISLYLTDLLKSNYRNGLSEQIFLEISLYLETLLSSSYTITENLDLFIILKELGENFLLPKERINKFISTFKDTFGYFEIVVFLDYIADNAIYKEEKESIIEIIHKQLTLEQNDSINEEKSKHSILLYTDKFMLFFDLLACPYLDEKIQKDILKHVYDKDNNSKKIIKSIRYKDADKQELNVWFYKWANKDSNRLLDLLQTKTLTTPY